jgi:hypothetical protein
MMRLEDIKAGALIQGIEPGGLVRIVTSEPIRILFPCNSSNQHAYSLIQVLADMLGTMR